MLRFDPKSYAGNKIYFPSFEFEVMLRIKKPIFRSHRNDTMYHGFLSTLVKGMPWHSSRVLELSGCALYLQMGPHTLRYQKKKKRVYFSSFLLLMISFVYYSFSLISVNESLFYP